MRSNAETTPQVPLHQGQEPRSAPAPAPEQTLPIPSAVVYKTVPVARSRPKAVRVLFLEISTLPAATESYETAKPRATAATVIPRSV